MNTYVNPIGNQDVTPTEVQDPVYSTGITSRVARMLGTDSIGFGNGLLKQMIAAGTVGTVEDVEGTDFVVGVVLGIAPRDELEAMLATQIAAVHVAILNQQRQLMNADNILKSESAGLTIAKLSRTYKDQLDALERLRSRRLEPGLVKPAEAVPAMKSVDRRRRILPQTDSKACLPADRLQSHSTKQSRP